MGASRALTPEDRVVIRSVGSLDPTPNPVPLLRETLIGQLLSVRALKTGPLRMFAPPRASVARERELEGMREVSDRSR
jgi:hypothetical protein